MGIFFVMGICTTIATRTAWQPIDSQQLTLTYSTSTTIISGIHYNTMRYYDPETGRYISRDLIGENGGLLLDGFVENGPINWIDVLGMIKCEHVLFIGHCSGNIDADIGRRLEIWRDAKLVDKSVCTHSTASAIGCRVGMWMGPKRDYFNDERTKDTREMDDSFAGNFQHTWCGTGNRGFNKPYFPNNPAKPMSDSEKQRAAHKGFYDLFMNDWNATQKAAKEHAKDCSCKCDGDRVYAILKPIDEEARKTYNMLRYTPKGILPELDTNGEVVLSSLCKRGKKAKK